MVQPKDTGSPLPTFLTITPLYIYYSIVNPEPWPSHTNIPANLHRITRTNILKTELPPSWAVDGRIPIVGLRPGGIRLQRGHDAADVDVPPHDRRRQGRQVARGVGVGENVEGLGARGVIAVAPELEEELAFLARRVGREVEGHDCRRLIGGGAVLDDEELVLGVQYDLAGLDPAAVGRGRVEDWADLAALACVDRGGSGGERGRCGRDEKAEKFHRSGRRA